MSNIQFILSGGTLTMENGPNGARPAYDLRHLLLAVRIEDDPDLSPKEKKGLLDQLVSLKIYKYDEDHLETELSKILDRFNLPTVYHLMNEYGVSPTVVAPYKPLEDDPKNNVSKGGLLDSINFDFPTHYKLLSDSVKNALKKSPSSAIVLGGTDTLEYYATAITNEMNGKDLLKKNNVIFLNSMYTFEDHPAHVAALVKSAIDSAKTISEKNGIPPLYGGYVVSPDVYKDGRVKSVKLHNVDNGIVKISSVLKDAFRSNNGISDTIEYKNGKAIHQPSPELIRSYEAEKRLKTLSYYKVAPPLIQSNHPQSIAKFLDQLLYLAQKGEKPFDIIPIEGMSAFKPGAMTPTLIRKIRHLNQVGIRTVLIEDMVPGNQNENRFRQRDFIPKETSEQIKSLLKEAGCVHISGPTAVVYVKLRQTLNPHSTESFIKTDSADAQEPTPSKHAIKIKYVPDQEIFKPMLEIAAKASSHIMIEALPDQALPDYYKDTFKQLIDNGTNITVGFKYNGQVYGAENGSTFVEGKPGEHAYEASRWLEKIGVKFSNETPLWKIDSEQAAAR